VRELQFAREVEGPGRVAEGFDLDALNGQTCRIRDYTAPDGRGGIDNQLAALLPLIEMQVGGLRLDALVQNAINNGLILLGLQARGLDSLRDDGCVSVELTRLTGAPLLGADGLLLRGQTLYPNPEPTTSGTGGATIRGGVLEAGPFDIALPVVILNADFVLDISDAYLRAEIDPETLDLHGFIGGGVTQTQLLDVVGRTEGVPQSVVEQARVLLGTYADLAPDASGACQQFSAVIEFRASVGFIGDARPDAGAHDAGAPEVDAGASEVDAGATDAGASEVDAGATDAGATDAGASEVDAGATDAGATDAGATDAGATDPDAAP